MLAHHQYKHKEQGETLKGDFFMAVQWFLPLSFFFFKLLMLCLLVDITSFSFPPTLYFMAAQFKQSLGIKEGKYGVGVKRI